MPRRKNIIEKKIQNSESELKTVNNVPLETVLIGAGLVLLILFLYTLEHLSSPFLIFARNVKK